MKKEDYVSFEVAKLLKEKGFHEETTHYYDNGTLDSFVAESDYNGDESSWISAPTLAQAAKWLRENYGIFVNVKPEKDIAWDEDKEYYDEELFWTYYVYSLKDIDNAESEWDKISPYYEVALNEGIKEALKMI